MGVSCLGPMNFLVSFLWRIVILTYFIIQVKNESNFSFSHVNLNNTTQVSYAKSSVKVPQSTSTVVLGTSSNTILNESQDPYITVPYYLDEKLKSFFYTFIEIGSPAQIQSVILDTGSSVLALPSSLCKKCGDHLNPFYDINASKTLQWIPCLSTMCLTKHCHSVSGRHLCGYMQRYVEGSTISGVFVSDIVAFSNTSHRNVSMRYDSIGCHLSETHLFRTQGINGIMGLTVPRNPQQSFFMRDFLREVNPTNKIFAMCSGDHNGTLQLGGYNSSWHIRPKCFSPFEECLPSVESFGSEVDISWSRASSSVGYSVYVEKVYFPDVNGVVSLDIDKFCSVDSGATYSYLPEKVLRSYVTVVQKKIEKELHGGCALTLSSDIEEICWPAVCEEKIRKYLPEIYLELGHNTTMIYWGPDSFALLEPYGEFCIQLTTRFDDYCVLGMSFMKHKNIIFDLGNETIGFVNAKCLPNHHSTDSAYNQTINMKGTEVYDSPPFSLLNVMYRMSLEFPFPVSGTFVLAFLGFITLMSLILFCIKRTRYKSYQRLETLYEPEMIVSHGDNEKI